MEQNNNTRRVISLLVDNSNGVLARISSLFCRRGFNIDSLAVGVTEDPTVSRMTIVVDGDEYIVEQLEKQLNKLIPVIKVKTLQPGSTIARTLSLIKVAVGAGQRAEIIRAAELMGAKVADATRSTLTLEYADTIERTETLEALLRPYGIREIVRTGVIAIEKGADPTRKDKPKAETSAVSE